MNSTVSGNQASDQAGGIFLANGSTVTRTNSIVAGNTQTSGGDEVILFNNGTLAGNGNLIGVAPLLATLGNYGGPTQTMPPLPGSPAIDPAVPATCSGPTALDQRGKPRVGACDIGAVESQGFIFAATSGDHQTGQATRPFAQPLTVILSEFGAPGVPLAGAGITVSGPGTGAGILAATPATTNASGLASVSVTANGTVGANYHVTATAGGTTSATFTLTNAPYVTIAGAASGDVRGGTPLMRQWRGVCPRQHHSSDRWRARHPHVGYRHSDSPHHAGPRGRGCGRDRDSERGDDYATGAVHIRGRHIAAGAPLVAPSTASTKPRAGATSLTVSYARRHPVAGETVSEIAVFARDRSGLATFPPFKIAPKKALWFSRQQCHILVYELFSARCHTSRQIGTA